MRRTSASTLRWVAAGLFIMAALNVFVWLSLGSHWWSAAAAIIVGSVGIYDLVLAHRLDRWN